MRYLYSFLLYLLTPLILFRLWWRGRKNPAYRQRWHERFGFYTPPADCAQPLWIHAVSYGEVQAAIPFIRALQARYPHIPLLVTTMTPTGSQRVREVFGSQVAHCYLPYDFPDAVARFLARTRPRGLILFEVEWWINCLTACDKRHIPIILANARLSPRSFAGYQRIQGLLRAALRGVVAIAAQSGTDKERFLTLLPEMIDKIHLVGNVKFDAVISAEKAVQGKALRVAWGEMRPVWIAASTHVGEEAFVLTVFAQLRVQFPDLVLIFVPRHPERFQAVADLCGNAGYRVARRSEDAAVLQDIDIYVGDTMGELLLLYAAADVAFVGGSFVQAGSHNPLEPAALGIATVLGRDVANVADVCRQLVAVGAARQARTLAELALFVGDWLGDNAARMQAGEAGRQFVADNRGALVKLLKLVDEVMPFV